MRLYPRELISPGDARLRPLRREPEAYVLMPFEPARLYDRVFEAIVRGFAGTRPRFNVRRADSALHSAPIMEHVLNGIASADVVVADMSGARPNVLYEVGIAQCMQPARHLLFLTQSLRDVPFDLRPFRHFVYESHDLDRLATATHEFVLAHVKEQRGVDRQLRELMRSRREEWLRVGGFPRKMNEWDSDFRDFHNRFRDRTLALPELLFAFASSLQFGYGFRHWTNRMSANPETVAGAVRLAAACLTRPDYRTAWRAAWSLQQMDREIVQATLSDLSQDIRPTHHRLLREIAGRTVIEYVREQAHSKNKDRKGQAADVLQQLEAMTGG